LYSIFISSLTWLKTVFASCRSHTTILQISGQLRRKPWNRGPIRRFLGMNFKFLSSRAQQKQAIANLCRECHSRQNLKFVLRRPEICSIFFILVILTSYNKRDSHFMCVVFSIGKPFYLVTKTLDYGTPSWVCKMLWTWFTLLSMWKPSNLKYHVL
jgi:hypothetical protein